MKDDRFCRSYVQAMPCYFFHARSSDRYVPDLMGIDLDSVHAAHGLAVQIIRDMTGGRLGLPCVGNWTIEVTDHDSRAVLIVPCLDTSKVPSSGLGL